VPAAYLLLVGIAFVTYFFRMRRERSTRRLNRYIRDFIVIGFFLVVVGGFFFLRRASLMAFIRPPTVTSLDQLDDLAVGTPVHLDGTVAADTPAVLRGYAAYVSEGQGGTTAVVTPELAIDLEDGFAYLSNDTYGEYQWAKQTIDDIDYFFLQPQDEVVVFAYVDDLTGDNLKVDADFVYPGSVESFKRHIRRQLVFPTFMMGLSLVSAIVVIAIPFVQSFILRHREGISAVEAG